MIIFTSFINFYVKIKDKSNVILKVYDQNINKL